jgi:hypothetical protein
MTARNDGTAAAKKTGDSNLSLAYAAPNLST